MEDNKRISDKELVERAQAKAAEEKIPGEIKLSTRPKKKLMLKTLDEKIIHFGAKGSTTFLEGASPSKRDSYRKRHSKILLKDGQKAYEVPNTPAYLSWHILW